MIIFLSFFTFNNPNGEGKKKKKEKSSLEIVEIFSTGKIISFNRWIVMQTQQIQPGSMGMTSHGILGRQQEFCKELKHQV